MATQLRRYEIADGRMDDFLAGFPKLLPIRKAYGLSFDGGYIDRENNQFVWLTSTAGDVEAFKAIESVYVNSPERAAAAAIPKGVVEVAHVCMVEKFTP
jgi:hypothetical protein